MESGRMVAKMERVYMSMQMGTIMMVFFKKVEGKVKGLIVGRMVINMWDNGNMIKWMEMVTW